MSQYPPARDGKGGREIPDPDATKLMDSMMGHSVEGAIPVNTRIRKCNSDENDRTPNGVLGIIKGTTTGICAMRINGHDINYGYIVEWDNSPGNNVFCVDYKLEEAT